MLRVLLQTCFLNLYSALKIVPLLTRCRRAFTQRFFFSPSSSSCPCWGNDRQILPFPVNMAYFKFFQASLLASFFFFLVELNSSPIPPPQICSVVPVWVRAARANISHVVSEALPFEGCLTAIMRHFLPACTVPDSPLWGGTLMSIILTENILSGQAKILLSINNKHHHIHCNV